MLDARILRPPRTERATSILVLIQDTFVYATLANGRQRGRGGMGGMTTRTKRPPLASLAIAPFAEQHATHGATLSRQPLLEGACVYPPTTPARRL